MNRKRLEKTLKLVSLLIKSRNRDNAAVFVFFKWIPGCGVANLGCGIAKWGSGAPIIRVVV